MLAGVNDHTYLLTMCRMAQGCPDPFLKTKVL